jgi:flagellar motility protein MotE (MotC chaperone)
VSVRFRILPVLIGVGGLMLALRVADIWLDIAHAQTTAAPAATAAATPSAAASAPTAPAAVPAAATPASPPASTTAGATPAPASSTAQRGASEPAPDPLLMSPSEIDVLQKLAQRRQELDKRAAEIAQQQVLLKAAEQRIDDKIAKLQSIETDIDGLADKRDQQEDARLKSLVKIYENMKPADAARIFEQLDMPILLEVLKRMREAKAAPILAAMDPEKAKIATTELAESKRQEQASAKAATP